MHLENAFTVYFVVTAIFCCSCQLNSSRPSLTNVVGTAAPFVFFSYRPTGRGKELLNMELIEIITKCKSFSRDAKTVYEKDDPLAAYDYIDELYDLLTDNFVGMDIPECESAESSKPS